MICAPIKEKDIAEVVAMIKKIPRKYDLIEIWVDEIEKLDENGILEICHAAKRKSLIFKLTKQVDFSFLAKCINKKIRYFEVTAESDNTTIQRIKTIIGDKKIIMIHRDLMKTPLFSDVLELAQQMKQKGADIIKIITKAEKLEDNLVPLRLLTNSQVLNMPVVSFCSGEMGRMSRIYASKFGSLIDYVVPSERYITGEGQIILKDFKKIMKYV